MRRRHGKGAPGRNRAQKAWFLAAPENPAQPNKSFYKAVSKGLNVTKILITLAKPPVFSAVPGYEICVEG